MNGAQRPTSVGADRVAGRKTASVRTDPLAVLGEDAVPGSVQTEPCPCGWFCSQASGTSRPTTAA